MHRHHRGRVSFSVASCVISIVTYRARQFNNPKKKHDLTGLLVYRSLLSAITERVLRLGRPAGIAAAITLKEDLGYEGFTVCTVTLSPNQRRPSLSPVFKHACLPPPCFVNLLSPPSTPLSLDDVGFLDI